MRTHTYVTLEISPPAFTEIMVRLEAAGYQHAFHESRGRMIIDMHGLAVTPKYVPQVTSSNSSEPVLSHAAINSNPDAWEDQL